MKKLTLNELAQVNGGDPGLALVAAQIRVVIRGNGQGDAGIDRALAIIAS